MNEYKSVSKFLEKNKPEFNFKLFMKRLLSKVLICSIIFLVGLIVVKIDNNNKQVIKNFLYDNNISFASLNNLYKKYIGDILPFESKKNDDLKSVFNEELQYSSSSIYKDGVALSVTNDYLVPILESGIVVFIGDKADYGKTIIIEQTDGIKVFYGNITNINVNLYDYVSKGEFLGSSNGNTIYLVFQKDEGYLDYKEYFS